MQIESKIPLNEDELESAAGGITSRVLNYRFCKSCKRIIEEVDLSGGMAPGMSMKYFCRNCQCLTEQEIVRAKP